MAIRWYCTYALSYREIEELMLERGVLVDHATLNRWVEKYSPLCSCPDLIDTITRAFFIDPQTPLGLLSQ